MQQRVHSHCYEDYLCFLFLLNTPIVRVRYVNDTEEKKSGEEEKQLKQATSRENHHHFQVKQT